MRDIHVSLIYTTCQYRDKTWLLSCLSNGPYKGCKPLYIWLTSSMKGRDGEAEVHKEERSPTVSLTILTLT